MVTADGIKLLDFGLAKRRHAPLASDVTVERSKPLTRTGMILGTVQYMAPGATRGARGRRADRHLRLRRGAVRNGHRPTRIRWDQRSVTDRQHPACRADAPLGLEPSEPAALDELVSGCLEKAPQRRWQTVAEVLARLASIRDEDPSRLVIRSSVVARSATAPKRSPPPHSLVWSVWRSRGPHGLSRSRQRDGAAGPRRTESHTPDV